MIGITSVSKLPSRSVLGIAARAVISDKKMRNKKWRTRWKAWLTRRCRLKLPPSQEFRAYPYLEQVALPNFQALEMHLYHLPQYLHFRHSLLLTVFLLPSQVWIPPSSRR
jgi:hypothetical protein